MNSLFRKGDGIVNQLAIIEDCDCGHSPIVTGKCQCHLPVQLTF